MRVVPINLEERRWIGRILDRRNRWTSRKRSRRVKGICAESRALKGERPHLLATIKEETAAHAHHGFSTWRVANNVGGAQPRGKVEPCSLPQPRPRRLQRPRVRGPLESKRIRHQTLRDA